MAHGVEEAGHPGPVGTERLEQFQHLLVAPTRLAREVVDNDVLEVEVADLHLIRVAMGHRECLGDRPHSDTRDGGETLRSDRRIAIWNTARS